MRKSFVQQYLVALLAIAQGGHLREELSLAESLMQRPRTILHRRLAKGQRELQDLGVVALESTLQGLGGMTRSVSPVVDLVDRRGRKNIRTREGLR